MYIFFINFIYTDLFITLHVNLFYICYHNLTYNFKLYFDIKMWWYNQHVSASYTSHKWINAHINVSIIYKLRPIFLLSYESNV